MNIHEKRKDIIQDCNLNFLVGSGLSSPYLRTLGDIETLLTEVETRESGSDKGKIIRASLYRKYFEGAILKNLKILESDEDSKPILESYCDFLKLVNSILHSRKSSILSKEVNIFTTNVDIFLDKALESVGVEYNDGFNGRFLPSFDLGNFKKSRSMRSMQYDNASELPVFNLVKLHGSLTWQLASDNNIVFSTDLSNVRKISEIEVNSDCLLAVEDGTTIDDLLVSSEGKKVDDQGALFLQAYDELLIVNPTKEKFKHTLLNQTHYELLRIFSNELERENTALFVMGFSFADEHIRELTLRVANSNPTLMVYVIAYSSKARAEIEARFGDNRIRNGNIEFIAPSHNEDNEKDDFSFDLATITTEIFGKLFRKDRSIFQPSPRVNTPPAEVIVE